MNILVIGSGVLGLTAAYNLVDDGHDVTIVDKSGPYAQASNRSFAWINSNHKLPAAYYELNRAGITAHEEFQAKFASRSDWFHQQGCVMFDTSPDREVGYEDRAREAGNLGYPVERIDEQQLGALEPKIDWPIDSALFFPIEGHLDNDVFGQVVQDLLREAGVVPEIAEVIRFETSQDRVRVEFADSTDRTYDQVVLAAGAESGNIAARSGLVLPVADLSQPGPRTHSMLGITVPTDVELNRVIISDRINVRPRHDGSMFVQVPYVEDRTEEGDSPELFEEVRRVMESELSGLFHKNIPMSRVILSGRSFPEDGLSIVGYLDEHQRAYSLVTHSGMTLAPLLGGLVAKELQGDTSSLLGAFRPARFAEGVTTAQTSKFIGRQ